ncbi:hypothetical protein E3A20_03140 [Planctomyces bekefii]|uniref:Uncharacterized protein n=1 Tax=Planctomyces bekefii TaxID=1653850 RepID=A0A5C6MGW8_9PLAN|nr:hypothetical protein E3A20_03140 [Planctomyces bekefii]
MEVATALGAAFVVAPFAGGAEPVGTVGEACWADSTVPGSTSNSIREIRAGLMA